MKTGVLPFRKPPRKRLAILMQDGQPLYSKDVLPLTRKAICHAVWDSRGNQGGRINHVHTEDRAENYNHEHRRSSYPRPPLASSSLPTCFFLIARGYVAAALTRSGFRSTHAAPLVILSIASTRAWTPPTSLETTARMPAACASVQSSSDANMVNRIIPHCGMEAEMSRAASNPFIFGIA